MQLLLLPLFFTAIQALDSEVVPDLRPRAPHPDFVPTQTFVKRQQFAGKPCAEVSASWAAQVAKSTGTVFVPAKVAQDCLLSVPVDVQGDIKEIAELKEFAQFQSNLNYVKDGLTFHNKKIDFFAALDDIVAKIKSGVYTSEWKVQLDLSNLFRDAGDNHFNWFPDILQPITFVRAVPGLYSLSKDGIELPQVYWGPDFDMQRFFKFDMSPIKTINGKEASEVLLTFAEQSDRHDIDAKYNTLFVDRASLSMGASHVSDGSFAAPESYVGDTTTFVFANGTQKVVQNWAAISSSFDFTGVTDGASFFKAFCTGQKLDTRRIKARQQPAPQAKKAPLGYPKPIIVQSGLAFQGYYLNGTGYEDTAVLAVPSFDPETGPGAEVANGLVEAQRVIRAFFTDAVSKNKKKLIIDLRGNGGGTIDVGYELFRQLFPTIDPYGGTRFRTHEAFEIFSTAISAFINNATFVKKHPEILKEVNEQVGVFHYGYVRDKDGKNFKNFKEYFGPYTNNKDTFTAIRRYNYSDPYGYTNTYTGFNLTGYPPGPVPKPQPFKAENIVLLQDGQCGSTCAIFSELMRSQGGVTSIAFGGRPQNAPMQAIGSTKGANVLRFDLLQTWMGKLLDLTEDLYGAQTAKYMANSAVGRIVNAKQVALRSTPVYGWDIAGRINSLDNIRPGDKTETPLEFVYEAADCRLFFPFGFVHDVNVLWKLGADAKWNKGKCVPNSTKGKGALTAEKGDLISEEEKEKLQVNLTKVVEGAGARIGSGMVLATVGVVIATVFGLL